MARPSTVASLTALAVTPLIAAGLLTGCGGSAHHAATHRAAATTSSAASTSAAGASRHAGPAGSGSVQARVAGAVAAATARGPISPAIRSAPRLKPSGRPAHPADVAVIRGWSDALRRGDVAAAAHYFQLPSLLINGPATDGQFAQFAIDTEKAAVAANELLPCGATLVSTDLRGGRWINALFIIGTRPGPGGGGCQGTKSVAHVDFIVHAGRIVDWVRAPGEAGDAAVLNGGGAPGTQHAGPPSGPVVVA